MNANETPENDGRRSKKDAELAVERQRLEQMKHEREQTRRELERLSEEIGRARKRIEDLEARGGSE